MHGYALNDVNIFYLSIAHLYTIRSLLWRIYNNYFYCMYLLANYYFLFVYKVMQRIQQVNNDILAFYISKINFLYLNQDNNVIVPL